MYVFRQVFSDFNRSNTIPMAGHGLYSVRSCQVYDIIVVLSNHFPESIIHTSDWRCYVCMFVNYSEFQGNYSHNLLTSRYLSNHIEWYIEHPSCLLCKKFVSFFVPENDPTVR